MILCCGEALIDMLPASIEGGGEGFAPHAGGAVFNTAVALGRLGEDVGFLYGLSTDMFGEILRAKLSESHVDVRHSVETERPTTLAFVKLENGSATYSFMDENSAGRMLAADEMPTLDDRVSALFLGGISLAVEPCGDTFAGFLDQESEERLVMVDPNIRPSFIKNESRFRERLAAIFKKADIVKVSDEDLEWLFPGPATLEHKAGQLSSDGPKTVIVTAGSEGAFARLASGEIVSVPIEKVNVADTVGAGDTFNAGFLHSLSADGILSKDSNSNLTGEQARRALAFAAKVAAVTVSRAGANPPWKHELN